MRKKKIYVDTNDNNRFHNEIGERETQHDRERKRETDAARQTKTNRVYRMEQTNAHTEVQII